MKRYSNLWTSICNMDNLRKAHYAARRGKSHYKEVKWVNKNENIALQNIHELLYKKNFTTSPYEIEDRFDGKKIRTIYKLPYYPDRIVQHALVNVCEYIWKASFIRDTFQSIPGRGVHDARKRVEKLIRNRDDLYVLKFDIQKYYPNINNEILKKELRTKIKCSDTLWLIDNIIDSNQGLPIGNYTSQYFGNIYLSRFDWWIKQTLKPEGYFRYCDDLVILTNSANKAHDYRHKIFDTLNSKYKLTVKPDWQVFPIATRALDFVGFVFSPDKIRLRKSIAKGVENKAKNIRYRSYYMTSYQIVNGSGSYWGWCKYGGGKGLWSKNMTTDIISHIDKAKKKIKEYY